MEQLELFGIATIDI